MWDKRYTYMWEWISWKFIENEMKLFIEQRYRTCTLHNSIQIWWSWILMFGVLIKTVHWCDDFSNPKVIVRSKKILLTQSYFHRIPISPSIFLSKMSVTLVPYWFSNRYPAKSITFLLRISITFRRFQFSLCQKKTYSDVATIIQQNGLILFSGKTILKTKIFSQVNTSPFHLYTCNLNEMNSLYSIKFILLLILIFVFGILVHFYRILNEKCLNTAIPFVT